MEWPVFPEQILAQGPVDLVEVPPEVMLEVQELQVVELGVVELLEFYEGLQN